MFCPAFSFFGQVVDDNAVNRKVLLARLKPYGVDCTQAVDGKDALNKMDPFPDHTFVCVFMDLQVGLSPLSDCLS